MINSSFSVSSDHFQFMVGDSEFGPLEDTSRLWDDPKPIVHSDSNLLLAVQTDEYSARVIVTFKSFGVQAPLADFDAVGEFCLETPSRSVRIWAPEMEDILAFPQLAIGASRVWGEVLLSKSRQAGPEYLFILRSSQERSVDSLLPES